MTEKEFDQFCIDVERAINVLCERDKSSSVPCSQLFFESKQEIRYPYNQEDFYKAVSKIDGVERRITDRDDLFTGIRLKQPRI